MPAAHRWTISLMLDASEAGMKPQHGSAKMNSAYSCETRRCPATSNASYSRKTHHCQAASDASFSQLQGACTRERRTPIDLVLNLVREIKRSGSSSQMHLHRCIRGCHRIGALA